jgi:hypothetical protein
MTPTRALKPDAITLDSRRLDIIAAENGLGKRCGSRHDLDRQMPLVMHRTLREDRCGRRLMTIALS